MTNALSKTLHCIQMRSGVEIWVGGESLERLQRALDTLEGSRFISFEGRHFNTADLVGIFTAQDMENCTRRKNGQWQCVTGRWHDKSEKCGCADRETITRNARFEEAVAKCGKCENGYVRYDNGSMGLCECVEGI